MKEPIKGKEYLCIKTVVIDSKITAYIKGKVYISEQNGCITNEKNNANHVWTKKGMNKCFTEIKETFEITKETIVKYKMKDEFPEVFEVKLEVGKWYKRPHGKALFFIVGDPKITPFEVYGFDMEGNWMNLEKARTFPDYEIEATEQEVFEALKNEAVRRGFVEGVSCQWECGGVIKIKELRFEDNKLWCNDDNIIMDEKGKWATIIQTITKEEAEKLLNCKIV